VTPNLSSGGALGQVREHGGKEGVQEFGEQSDRSELEDAADVVRGYMVARADEDWSEACSYLSSRVVKQLESFASSAKQATGEGCSDVLGAWTPPLPAALREESAVVENGTLRVEGEEAFLIYRGPQRGDFAMPMTDEDGSWKVAALAAAPLT